MPSEYRALVTASSCVCFVTGGFVAGKRGLNIRLSKNCQKIFFLSEKFCPTMPNLGALSQSRTILSLGEIETLGSYIMIV